MLFLKIILGLFGLGIIVFVHELGHFLAARLVGIDVEAFSIGWGHPIVKKKIGAVEYRLGMFPLGGYCKMKGENEFQETWENRKKEISPERGSFFAVSPVRRIAVSFAGPLFNLLFAILVLSLIWGLGFEIETLSNRIVLVSEVNGSARFPADEAGLRSGDRIIEVNGRKTPYYHDVQENIAVNPEKLLPLTIDRDGEILHIPVRPSLDKKTGAGRIGVYFWTDPVIDKVAEGGPAMAAGLRPGDRILRANGEPVLHSVDFLGLLANKPSLLLIDYERDGEERQARLVPLYSENGEANLGISYGTIHYRTPALSFPVGLAKGVGEAWKTLVVSLRSLGLLFRGVDLTQAVSGPVRITYMVGDIATEGFGQSFADGIRSMMDFLALISIALCIMNLLPLPILDGGMIVLFIIELIKRKPLHPRFIAVFQTLGAILIFGLMIFAVFGDILYLARR
jgi:regulator of sigma E protease